jgi:hypothetical protein
VVGRFGEWEQRMGKITEWNGMLENGI